MWQASEDPLPNLLTRASSQGHLIPWQLAFPRVKNPEENERDLRWKLRSFYNLILEVTSHYFCNILFIRNKSVIPAHVDSRGRSFTRGCGYQEVTIIEDHFRGYLPQHIMNEWYEKYTLRTESL